MSESDSGEWALSEAKDWKDGRHRRDNEWVHDHAGQLSDGELRKTLSVLEGVYQRAYERGWIDGQWPDSIEGTKLYRRLRKHYESEAYAERVEHAPDELRAHVGSQRDEVDVSGWQDIERIRDVVAEQHLRLYIFGEPGTGKTRSGCLVARHWLEQRLDEGDDPLIYTNIRTLAPEHERIRWVQNWPELREEIDMTMTEMVETDARPFLFLFDEASSQASGRGSDGYEASTKLATLVYKIRKYGGAMAIIGHDGKDLHPAVRELCQVLEKPAKDDPKIAQFYATIQNREGREPITPEITGWPDSMWQPNEHDPAPWAWNNDDEGLTENIEQREWEIYHAVRARQEGVSVAETAEIVDKSAGWVSTQYSDGSVNEEAREIVKRVSDQIE